MCVQLLVLQQKLQYSVPWITYWSHYWMKIILGLGVHRSDDNTSVNVGSCNSLKTRIKVKNPSVHISGCNYHILHMQLNKQVKCLLMARTLTLKSL